MSDISLDFDTRSVEQGTVKAVSAFETLIRTLERLEKVTQTSAGRQEKDISRAFSQMSKLSKDLKTSWESAMNAMNKGTPRGALLVTAQNKALADAFDQRLALNIALGDEELKFWKKHGVALGGLQKAQLADSLAANTQEYGRYQAALQKMAQAQSDADAKYVAMRKDSLGRGNVQIIGAAKTALAELQASEAALNKSEETRYQAALQKMAQAQADADAKYVAMRKDSLGRGNVQIIGAAKTALAELQASEAALNKSEETRYQAALQKMAQAQADADARYVAMRKDSLGRGNVQIIGAAKTALAELQAAEKASAGSQKALMQAQEKASGLGIPVGAVAGPFKEYDAVKRQAADLKRAQEGLNTSNDALSTSFKKLTVDGNDLHSMARGLASSFGLLWLTWGNLVPLFAGAGISAAVKKSFDIGSEVEYQIKYMQILGDTSAATGEAIRKELQEIDKASMFSLPELAKAMVQMQQAGATAVDALEMIKPAAALATLGQTELSTATGVLMQTMEIFGRNASDSSKIAAELFVASKSGSLTIKDLGESMKYASETSSRFGKTTEESLAILVALSKAGIKGSSGGTALVNFLRDIAGRSSTSIAALKALETASKSTIAVFEKTGAQRSAVDIFNDISEAAKKLSSQDADKLLGKIFSDRGGRAFFAMVREGTVDLKDLTKAIAEASPESMFKSAQGLMDTTKGAFEILKSSLVGVMDDVFSANESAFKSFILDITAAINSPEFKSAVFGIVQSVRGIYETISNNITIVKTLGEAFLAWKAVSVITTILSALSGGIATATIAMQGMSLSTLKSAGSLSTYTAAAAVSGTAMLSNAAAARANALGLDAVGIAAARAGVATATASGGMRALAVTLGILTGPIGWVITGLTILGSLFLMTRGNAETGSKGVTEYLDKEGKLQVTALDKVIDKIRARDELLKKSSNPMLVDLVTEARDSARAVQDEYNAVMLKGQGSTTYAKQLAERVRIENANVSLLETRLAKEDALYAANTKAREDREKAARDRKTKAEMDALRPTGAAVTETEKGAGRRSPLFEIIKREGEQAAALAETRIATDEFDKINIELAKNLKGLNDTYEEATKKSKELTPARRAEIDADKLKAETLIKANAATQVAQALAKKEYEYTIQRIEAAYKEIQATDALTNSRFKAAKESERQIALRDSKYAFEQSLKYQLPAVQSAEKASYDVSASYIEKLKALREESFKRMGEMYSEDGTLLPGADIEGEYKRLAASQRELLALGSKETGIASAKAYQEAWDQTIGQISSDFTSQMLEGTLDVKDFMVKTFAKTVLQPQLNLLFQQGFSSLLGGAGGWFSSMMGAPAASTSMMDLAGAAVLGLPSFAGGGDTGNGPRSGGLDGQGGYLAMLHPKETVTDHTVAGSGASAPVYVTINNTVGDVATKSMLDQYNAATVKQIQAGIGRSMRYNGAMSRG